MKIKSLTNELLSEILGFKIFIVKEEDELPTTIPRENDIVYERLNELQYCINIHEISNKCKEWAFKQKYSLLTQKWKSLNEWVVYISKYSNKEEFTEDTEPDAVIKSCQWILEQIQLKEIK